MSYENKQKAEIRQLIYERLLKYIKVSKKDPKEMTVLCFPGEDYRELWIYEKAGIQMKNIYAFESDEDSCSKLEKANLGINIIPVDFIRKLEFYLDDHIYGWQKNCGTWILRDDNGRYSDRTYQKILIPRCDILSMDLMCGPKRIHQAMKNAMHFMKDDCFLVTNCVSDGNPFRDKELNALMKKIMRNAFPEYNWDREEAKEHTVYLQTTAWLKNFFNFENDICYKYYGTRVQYGRQTLMKGIIARIKKKENPDKILRTSEEIVGYTKKPYENIFKYIGSIRHDMMHESYSEQESEVFENA
jgi:hypothetical protein